jgi:phospholipid/cholesterol/gamma-HCH transport system substrate-binding protein
VPSFEGEMANPGDFLQGEIESDIFSSVTEKLNPLQAKVENVIVSADSLMAGLTDILDTKSRENLKSSIEQLNSTISNFKAVSESVNTLIKNNEDKLDRTLSNAELMTENLSKLSDSLVNSNLAATVKKMEATVTNLNKILGSVESGEGTIGKLLKDDEMYTNLTNASKELEELLNEMKLHPKRFVHFSLFGKRDKGYNPEPKQIEE